MKRILSVIIVLLLLLSGCVQQKPPETVFWLDKVEDVGTFEGLEKFERYYDGYTDELIPSDKYGELIPFVGKILTASGDWPMTSQRYGLCTTDGKIVVDPVFENCSLMQAGDVSYYDLTYAKTIQEIETAQESEDYDMIGFPRSVLIRTDGSFCMELDEVTWAKAYTLENGEGRITVFKYSSGIYDGGLNFKVYDEEMELLYTLENLYDHPDFSDELVAVMHACEDYTAPSEMYYIDKDGNKVIDGSKFSQIKSFSNGLAEVQNKENGLFGYIDTSGEYVIRPQFKWTYPFGKLGYANVRTNKGSFVIDAHGNRPLGDRIYEGGYLLEDGRVYNAGSQVNNLIDVISGDYLKCPICGKNSNESKMDMDFLSEDEGIIYIYIHTNCDGKTGVFTSDGTIKEHVDYTNISVNIGIEGLDERYMFLRDTSNDMGCIMYDREKKEIVYTFENMYYNAALSGGNYVIKYYPDPENVSMEGQIPAYRIYVPGEGLDDEIYSFFNITKTADGEYYSVITDDYSAVLDEEFNTVIKLSVTDND